MSHCIIADGHKCNSYLQAAKVLGCSQNAITNAVRANRRSIKGKVFWFEGEEEQPPVLGKSGTPCIVDDTRYESVGIAARTLNSKPSALRLALNMKDTFKGHSISWVEEEEL